MKKVLLLTCLFITLALAISSCISAVIDDEEVVIPEPPDGKKLYFLRIKLKYIDGEVPYDWSNYQKIGFIAENESGTVIYANREIKIPRESGYDDVLLMDTIKTDEVKGQGYAYAPYEENFSGPAFIAKLDSIQDQRVVSSKLMDEDLKKNIKLVANPATFKFD